MRTIALCMEDVYASVLTVDACLECREAIANADVVAIIDDEDFWLDLKVLCNLLEPLSKVVMAIQSDTTKLADVTRYWLYLANEIAKAAARAPYGNCFFAMHHITVSEWLWMWPG